MEKLNLLENQLNDLYSRINDLEKLKVELIKLNNDLIEIKKDLDLDEKEEAFICSLEEYEIEKIFENALSFIESIFENKDGDLNPEFQDMRFEVEDYYNVKLDYIEVNTSTYLNEVLTAIDSDSDDNYNLFVQYVKERDFSLFDMCFHKTNDIQNIFKFITKAVTEDIDCYSGFYTWSIDEECVEMELNYNNELNVTSLTVNDWYNDVFIAEFDISSCINDAETEFLDKLNEYKELQLEQQED